MEMLQIKEISERAEGIRKKVINEISELDLPIDNIPANMTPKDGPLKLVFIIYSAVKTTVFRRFNF